MTGKTVKASLYSNKPKRAPRAALFYLSLVGVCFLFADFLPLPFLPDKLDLNNIYLPPFAWQNYGAAKSFHWLGTDRLGRDVLANIIYGCRTAILLSIPAMAIASVLGLLLGGIAGYYGNKTIRVSLVSLLILLLTLMLAYFYGFYLREHSLAELQMLANANKSFYIGWLTFSSITVAGVFLSTWINKHIPLSAYLSVFRI